MSKKHEFVSGFISYIEILKLGLKKRNEKYGIFSIVRFLDSVFIEKHCDSTQFRFDEKLLIKNFDLMKNLLLIKKLLLILVNNES